jgi:hypothetical protein
MSKSTWFSRLLAALRPPCSSRRRRRPLSVEPLEDRCVPATFTPTYFQDTFHMMGRYSLRDAVSDSNKDQGSAPDTIQLLAGTYVLSLPNAVDPNTHQSLQENVGLRGDLDITSNTHKLTIQGVSVGGIIKTKISAADLQDRLFQIVKPGTEVVFRDLILQGGLAQDDGTDNTAPGTTAALGGAILSRDGATITLDHVILRNNTARGGDSLPGSDGFGAQGGAIYAGKGFLTVMRTQITNNQALGGAGGVGGDDSNPGGAGGDAEGGGIYFSGVGGTGLIIDTSDFSFNRAGGGAGGTGGTNLLNNDYFPMAGTGGAGGNGRGGALVATDASPSIGGTFSQNRAEGGAGGNGGQNVLGLGQGGDGGDGGDGSGGGLFLSDTGVATINASITANKAKGGMGGNGAAGADYDPVDLSKRPGANGGRGGSGGGGGITLENGLATLGFSSVVDSNQAQGADGGRGGDGQQLIGDFAGGRGGDASGALGGGLFVKFNSSIIMQGGSLSGDTAFGGHGGHGGNGVPSDDNLAGQGGAGGMGGRAFGGGGAAINAGIYLTNVSASSDTAIGGDGGTGGDGSTGELTHLAYGFGGAGGMGGSAQGGSLYGTKGASIGLTNAWIMGSAAFGGQGGAGGAGKYVSALALYTNVGPEGGQGGDGGAAQGGAISTEDGDLPGPGGTYVIGSLIGFSSAFGGQGGAGGAGGSSAEGGGGSGGNGGSGGAGQGAAVHVADDTLELTRDHVIDNQARGGRGGDAGQGGAALDGFGGHGGNAGAGGGSQGGGLFAERGAITLLTDTIAYNTLQGGHGGNGGGGGQGKDHGGDGGVGAAGGLVEGGGVIAQGATLTVTASTIDHNALQGGDGGNGGPGGKAMMGSGAPGGDGGAGGRAGAAHGGGFLLEGGDPAHEGSDMPQLGTATFTNATISTNTIAVGDGGFGGAGGQGDNAPNGHNGFLGGLATKEGAGIYLTIGSLTLQNSTIAFNRADGTIGSGGGVFNLGGTVNAFNSLIARNIAFNGPDFDGAFGTAVHTLVGNSAQASNLSAVAGNIINVDPRLGPLADNGGPTFTHALLSGSPAINHGDNTLIPQGVTTDQRGFSRIVGGTVDIGAYEFGGLGIVSSPPSFPPSASQMVRLWLNSIDGVFAEAANTWAGLPSPRDASFVLSLARRLVAWRGI